MTDWNLDHFLVNGVVYAGSNTITITMDGPKDVEGVYVQAPPPPPTKVILTMEADIGGTTTPSPGNYPLDVGTRVIITATPNAGYVFDHWTWNGVFHNANPTDITINDDTVVHAFFKPVAKVSLTMQHNAGGYTNPGIGTYFYPIGTSVTVTATPTPGHIFRRWVINGKTYLTRSVTILMNQNVTARAFFDHD